METTADWRASAACKGLDPDLFHPAKDDTETTARAKAVCAICPSRGECLDFAIRMDERQGIWGGVGERTRRQMRAAMRAKLAS